MRIKKNAKIKFPALRFSVESIEESFNAIQTKIWDKFNVMYHLGNELNMKIMMGKGKKNMKTVMAAKRGKYSLYD